MQTKQIIRFIQLSLVGFFGLYALVVAFGNITDYQSNYQFVQGVLSMKTTFPGNALMYRAINSTTFYHISYIFLIILECVIAIACLFGAIQMLKNIKGNKVQFQESKKWAFIGLFLAITVWFMGFQVVGGEWFAMWESTVWNGLDPAFRLTTYISTTIIILMLNGHEEQ